MTRTIAEKCNALSIYWLNKNHCIPKHTGSTSGVITWTFGNSDNKNSVGYTITINESESNICLQYTHTNQLHNKEDMIYKINLVTTTCNFGGVRYWFICPLSKDGKYCGRRVGVVYNIGKYFGCRHCGNIAYQAQMKSGKWRGCSITFPDIEKAEREIKRYYYKGAPTKKYKKVIKMNEKLEQDMLMIVRKTDKRFR